MSSLEMAELGVLEADSAAAQAVAAPAAMVTAATAAKVERADSEAAVDWGKQTQKSCKLYQLSNLLKCMSPRA